MKLNSLLKQGNSYSSVLEEILVYLRETLPEEEKEMIMDSLEVIQNKGYVSIADADYNRGFSEGEIKGITDAKREMAKAMLMEGISIDKIRIISGLSEKEILKL